MYEWPGTLHREGQATVAQATQRSGPLPHFSLFLLFENPSRILSVLPIPKKYPVWAFPCGLSVNPSPHLSMSLDTNIFFQFLFSPFPFPQGNYIINQAMDSVSNRWTWRGEIKESVNSKTITKLPRTNTVPALAHSSRQVPGDLEGTSRDISPFPNLASTSLFAQSPAPC